MTGHVPVLVDEAVRFLVVDPEGTYVDATLGGGGHAAAIAGALRGEGRVIGIDCDPAAVARVRERPPAPPPRFTAVSARFSEIEAALAGLRIAAVDGILADLGLSSDQLDDPHRGLSGAASGPLDMRLDPDRAEPAHALVRRLREEALAAIFREQGELPRSRAAARAAKRAADQAKAAGRPLTAHELREALAPLYPGPSRPRRIAQAFQSLRIAVNDELGELSALLAAAARLVRPGGSLVVIAYHSLEDRLVKHAFAPPRPLDPIEERPAPLWEPLTRKPIRPTEAETARNPRARSALLRAARRLGGSSC